MNLRAIFENRSGRVIAVLRFVFATVFLVSLAIEKVTAGETIRAGLILLGSYVTLSLLVLPIAWRSWWLDHRLAMPTMARVSRPMSSRSTARPTGPTVALGT